MCRNMNTSDEAVDVINLILRAGGGVRKALAAVSGKGSGGDSGRCCVLLIRAGTVLKIIISKLTCTENYPKMSKF